MTSLVAQTVKRLCLQCGRPGFDPWVRKILWRRKWQPTPVLLPGKSHGQRSMVGYSPWGGGESDTTERLHFHFTLGPITEKFRCKIIFMASATSSGISFQVSVPPPMLLASFQADVPHVDKMAIAVPDITSHSMLPTWERRLIFSCFLHAIRRTGNILS